MLPPAPLPGRLMDVMGTMHEVGRSVPLVFPLHPRTRAKIDAAGVDVDRRTVRLVDPLGYLDFLCLEAHAAVVLTDSGGIQEETSVLGVPCLTLRENTERPVTVIQGTNRLVGYERTTIVAAVAEALAADRAPCAIPLWDGQTAERIVDILRVSNAPPAFVPPALVANPTPEFAVSRQSVQRSLSGS
jgi:UDP-N-acetylglucosamine 2-epimerase (non-hydrolysing)